LSKQGAKKFILDLRFSGYGKPEDGVDLANLFLDKGLITYLQGQKLKRENFNADPNRASFKNQQLVVLTNRGTAGAAEIAAAAILDNKRAEIVGEKTYGDAAVRRAITMDDGSAVILAVAKYYSPSGKAIQDNPVAPTIMVAETEPAVDDDDDNTPTTPPATERKEKEEDAVLKRAIELLTKGKQEAASGATAPAAAPNAAPERPDLPLTDKNQKK